MISFHPLDGIIHEILEKNNEENIVASNNYNGRYVINGSSEWLGKCYTL